MVSHGPQRGDLEHWFYDTVDLAPFLRTGDNWIAALVWNFGRFAPMAQFSARTGFVCDGDGLATPGDWEVARLEDWNFEMMHSGIGEFYIDVGPGEILRSGPSATVDGVLGEPGRDLSWKRPHVICQAEERGAPSGGTPWMLIPRSIPPMRYVHRSDPPVVRNRMNAPLAFGESGEREYLLEDGDYLLLDYQELICAYPRLFVSCKGCSVVTLTYDEALWNEKGKGNRNDVEGKESRGYQDRIELNGWSLSFEPLWWRTYRYLRIEVSGDPVSLRAVEAIETGYPYEVESSFEADDARVEPIWDVSVRTAERCAGETYFDCPYYEQLQYVGDTRIQALIGYYLGRDRALQRNALETLGWSLMENGLTQSRYPSRQTQVIPPFSLWWVMMLWDQMLYDPIWTQFQPDLTNHIHVDIAKSIVDNFDSLGLSSTPFWRFADWVPGWSAGIPNEPSNAVHRYTWLLSKLAIAPLTDVSERLQVLLPGDRLNVLRRGQLSKSELHEFLGNFESQPDPSLPKEVYLALLAQGRGSVGGEYLSEHEVALVALISEQAGVVPPPWPKESLINAAKCTYYFSYYKHLAMFRREDAPFDYLEELKPWTEMIEDGLTTFAENPEPTRSDCHAWSAHPILGFFQIVAGVTSIAPGWRQARIMPHPGSLRRFDARIAHPDGELQVAYEDGQLTINSPVPFDLDWRGKRESLEPGRHQIG